MYPALLTTIMFRNSRGWLANWLLACGLWLGMASLVLAQQPVKSTKTRPQAKKSAGIRKPKPRRVQPVPSARKPAYTKKGVPRKLSPDQLWDAKPDSTHPSRGPFRLLIYTGLGTSLYATAIQPPGSLSGLRLRRLGVPATLRIMWQTDHRLRMGLETGFVRMYTYRGIVLDKDAQIRVSAIPILAVFSMSVAKRLAVYAGTGPYLIHSNLSFDGTTRGSVVSLGWMAAATYTQPLTKNLGLAAEVKWYDASQTDDVCFIAQATLVWRALTW